MRAGVRSSGAVGVAFVWLVLVLDAFPARAAAPDLPMACAVLAILDKPCP